MAQIHGKQLRDDSILLAKLDNAGSQGTILFGTGTLIGLTDAPTADTDLANKAYVDSLAAGLDPKESVRFTTLAPITGTYNSSGGTGGSGAFTGVDLTDTGDFDLDGNTVQVGDRILIKNQASALQNGIYVVTTAGATGAIERSTDHDGTPAGEVSSGNYTFVELGATNEGKGYVLQGDGVLTLNTDNLVWVQFSQASAYTGGNGIDITSNVISVDLSTTSGLTFNTGQLEVDPSDGITLGVNGVAVNLTTNGGLGFTGTAGSGTLNIVSDTTSANTIGITTTANGAGILYNNVAGLTETSEILEVNLAAAGGLEFAGGAIGVNADVTTGATVAPVTVGANGIGVSVDNTTITHTGGTLSVDVTGLSLTASDITNFNTAVSTEVFDAANFVDSARVNFTITAGTSVTADLITNTITEAYLTTSVAGNGLTGGNGTPLAVNVAAAGGLEIVTDAVGVNADVTTGATVAPVSVGVNGVGVSVDNTTITHSGGTLSVDVAGLSLTASDITNFNTAVSTEVFDAANFVDSARVNFTVTAGTSVTADLITNTITEAYLTTSVAGTGLTGGNGSALSVVYSTAGATGASIQASDLASTATGLGASLVGVEDSAGNFTATDVEGVLAELYAAIASGGVPVDDNKNMTASVTASDGDLATVTTIVGTPSGDSYVQVFINGVKVNLTGNLVGDCYFSNDSGVTARAIANITAGDELYWNGSIAGYELDANDRVDFDYVV